MLQAQPGARNDAALMRAVAEGDRQAVADLYDRHAGAVYGMAMSLLRDTNLAQDTTQEAFVRLWTRAHTFDPRRGTAQAWLVSVARNLALDELRRQRRRSEGADRLARAAASDADEDIDRLLDWQWQSRRVVEAMFELSALQRETVQLVYLQGYTIAEVAARLGVAVGTIKSRLHSALQALRAALDEETRGAGSASDARGTDGAS